MIKLSYFFAVMVRTSPSLCQRKPLSWEYFFFLSPKQMSPDVLNCIRPSFYKVGQVKKPWEHLCVRKHVTGDFPESLQRVSAANGILNRRAVPVKFTSEAPTHLFLEPSVAFILHTHTCTHSHTNISTLSWCLLSIQSSTLVTRTLAWPVP